MHYNKSTLPRDGPRHEKSCSCICENMGADQQGSNSAADQLLCYRYINSTITLLFKSEISSILPLSVSAQSGLCRNWSESPTTGFLALRLICLLGYEYPNEIYQNYEKSQFTAIKHDLTANKTFEDKKYDIYFSEVK